MFNDRPLLRATPLLPLELTNEKERDGSRIVGEPSGKFVGKLFVSTLKEVSI